MNDVEKLRYEVTRDIGRACYRRRGHGGNEETPGEGGLVPTSLLRSPVPINSPKNSLA